MSAVTKASLITTTTTTMAPPTTSLSALVTNYSSRGNSSVPRGRWYSEIVPFLSDIVTALLVMGWLEIVASLLLNLFLLGAILSSPLLRSRMRNRLLLSLVASNLMTCFLAAPGRVHQFSQNKMGSTNCYMSVVNNVLCHYVQNFITTWGMAGVLLHYLARLYRYEGPRWVGNLSPVLQRALPSLLVALPWIVALLVEVPLIFAGLEPKILKLWTVDGCFFFMQPWAKNFMLVLSFLLPAAVLVVLVVVIIVVVIRNSRRSADVGKKGVGEVEKAEAGGVGEAAGKEAGVGPPVISESATGVELEACKVHVLTAILTVLMLGSQQFPIASLRGDFKSLVIASVAVFCLGEVLLPVLLALAWMFMLPDVRERVRQLLLKVPDYLPFLRRCRSQTPPEAPGDTSVNPVAFRDLSLSDE